MIESVVDIRIFISLVNGFNTIELFKQLQTSLQSNRLELSIVINLRTQSRLDKHLVREFPTYYTNNSKSVNDADYSERLCFFFDNLRQFLIIQNTLDVDYFLW